MQRGGALEAGRLDDAFDLPFESRRLQKYKPWLRAAQT